MADNLADLSGEERAKRVAELKAKMQASAAANKAAREATGGPAAASQPAAAGSAPAPQPEPAPAPAKTAVAEPPAAEAVVVVTQGTAQPAAGSNGASGNGAAAAAAMATSTVVLQPGEPEIVEETPEQKVQKQMNRREFLTYAWGAALGLLVLESGVAMYLFMLPRFKAGEFGGKFFVPTSSIPPSDAAPVPYTDGKFWLVQTQESEPRALYMVCTHLGCLYKWATSNSRFECPCHGSKFTHDGFYIEGPAPRSLDTFPTTVEGEVLVVDTGKKISGTPAALSPARVVPA